MGALQGMTYQIEVAAFVAAGLAWLMGALSFLGVWARRGPVSGRALALNFLGSLGDLPPAARPHLARLALSGLAFFTFVTIGLLAALLLPR
jgi:hypothetical protein